jgi:hypothetical protein
MTSNDDPVRLLTQLPLGTRVVVRSRLAPPLRQEALYTDALGYLRRIDDSECLVETKRGEVSIRLQDVVAAKEVPSPPAPRIRRSAEG